MVRRVGEMFFFLSMVVTLGSSCGVPKQVHCKFVKDIGEASANYKAAATQASNRGWEAQADQLQQTATSEKNTYCKGE